MLRLRTIIVIWLFVLAAQPAYGQSGTIRGRVTDAESGAGLDHASIYVYSLIDTFVANVFTDSTGAYEVSLAAGTYFVNASGPSTYIRANFGPPCDSYWCLPSSSTPVVVPPGGERANVNIALSRGGSLSGRVTAADGSPVVNARVRAQHAVTELGNGAYTDASGNYSIPSLTAGPYYVLVDDQVLYGVGRCIVYCRLEGAPQVLVRTGETTAGIDIVVPAPLAGGISGTVLSAPGNTPTGFALVTVRNRATGRKASLVAQSDGSFVISGLEPGIYSVWARDISRWQVYGGGSGACDDDEPGCVAVLNSGTPVVVSTGVTPNVNVVLPVSGGFTMHVSAVGTGASVDAQVVLYTESGLSVIPTPHHASGSGSTIVDEVAPGRYYAVVSSNAYLPRVYGAAASCTTSPCRLTDGQVIQVTPGTPGPTLSIALEPRVTGSVSGRVVITGATQTSVLVLLQNIEGLSVGTALASSSDGTYTISNVAPGTYYARTQSSLADEWFGGTCVGCGAGQGVAIQVLSLLTYTGADFELGPGGTIQGTITRPFPGLGTRIDVFNERGEIVRMRYCSTDSPCAYRVDGLPPGRYRVRAMDSEFSELGSAFTSPLLVGQIHPGIDCSSFECPLDGAAVLQIDASGPGAVQRADFTLRLGGRIRARAIARGFLWTGIMPVTFRLQLQDALGRPAGLKPSLHTLSDFVGLPAGLYYLRTVDGQKKGYVDKAWRDTPCTACPPLSGTPIRVVEGEITEVEIVLDEGHGLRGSVVDAANAHPLENVTVRAYALNGAAVGEAVTGSDGAWRIGGLAPGEYHVATSNSYGYADEVYDDRLCAKCDVTRGQRIALSGSGDAAPVTIALARAGVITGLVTDSMGVAAGSVGVELFDQVGVRVARASTRSNGTYEVAVPPGAVFARTLPSAGRRSVLFDRMPCTDADCNPTAGTPIAAAAGVTRSGVDFALPGCAAFSLQPLRSSVRYLNAASEDRFLPLGGTAPYRFGLSDGSLPPGLTLDQSLGTASGTATSPGRYAFEVGAVDATGCATTARYVLNVVDCRVGVSADVVSFSSVAATKTLSITGACVADVSSDANWILPLPASTLVAPATLQISVTQNPGPNPRETVINVGDRRVTVRQGGFLSTSPYGFVDAPQDGETVSGAIAIGGWALDDLEVTRVTVFRDAVSPEPLGQQVYLGDAVRVRGARPDVEALFPNVPFKDRAGWGFLLLTNMLPSQGNGAFRLHVYAQDVEGHTRFLGSRLIFANNATSTLPFGAIDTPGQGETISGSAYINFGWALTPLDKTIPANGSTIGVLIDGSPVGTVNYGHYRSDVATLFPGLHNSNGAIGYRLIDTTLLAHGIHTISWVVTDSAGASQGIGSRYFHVDNTMAVTSAAAPSPEVPVAGMRASEDVVDARRVRLDEMQPFRLELKDAFEIPEGCAGAFRGVEVVAGDRRPLPAGSVLDSATGTFTWQPGPGFIGEYHLLFTWAGCDGRQATLPLGVRIVRTAGKEK